MEQERLLQISWTCCLVATKVQQNSLPIIKPNFPLEAVQSEVIGDPVQVNEPVESSGSACSLIHSSNPCISEQAA